MTITTTEVLGAKSKTPEGFKDLTVKQLREAVAGFVGEDEAKSAENKNELMAILLQEGVDFQQYWAFQNADTIDPAELIDVNAMKAKAARGARDAAAVFEEAPLPQTVLVKMIRNNFRFDAFGHTFSKDHPYVAMPSDEAQEIFDAFEGFTVATPKEVQNYYS